MAIENKKQEESNHIYTTQMTNRQQVAERTSEELSKLLLREVLDSLFELNSPELPSAATTTTMMTSVVQTEKLRSPLERERDEMDKEENIVQSFASLAGIENNNDQQYKNREQTNGNSMIIDDMQPEMKNPDRSDEGKQEAELEATGNSNEEADDERQQQQQQQQQQPDDGQFDVFGGEFHTDADTGSEPKSESEQHEKRTTSEEKPNENLQDHSSELGADFDKQQVAVSLHFKPASPPSSSPITEKIAQGSVSSNSGSIQDENEETGSLEGDELNKEDICSKMASNSTLKQLKLSTLQDVLVCEQNRQSMEAARRLFDNLVRRQDHKARTKGGRSLAAGLGLPAPQESSSTPHRKQSKTRGGSLSSAELDEDENDDERGVSASEFPSHETPIHELYDTKVVCRSGSSVSSSNFRQTLVCSVSPTSQLGGSSSDISSADAHPLYPIDGDEILQCRAAYRENKRLIQQQQERASSEIHQRATSANLSKQLSPRESQVYRFNQDIAQQSMCSRCKQRVYPVDKIELDFTRTTLNIHRNCFKCQVCSTLLRLETYAAIDAKLYCPAHIKCVTPSR